MFRRTLIVLRSALEVAERAVDLLAPMLINVVVGAESVRDLRFSAPIRQEAS